MKQVVAFRPFDQQLRSAIAQKRLLQIGYKGKQRLVEPHDYGIKNGVVRIMVYQLNDGRGNPRRVGGCSTQLAFPPAK